jgi:PAS domain S-box-containing protein
MVDLTDQERLNDVRDAHIAWSVAPHCSDFRSDHPSLVDTEALFRVAVESSPSGVLVVGPDGVIVQVNPEKERQFGYPSEELVGRPVDMLLHEAQRSIHVAYRESFARDYQKKALGAGRRVGRRKDGSEIAIEIGLNPVRIDQKVFVLASVVDIRSDHFTSILALMESSREAPDLRFDFIAATRGLDYVAEVRDTNETAEAGTSRQG